MASTVGTVGRKTGVEGSLRQYLGSRRPSDLERIDPEILRHEPGNKRRRISNDEDESYIGHPPHRTLSGHTSIETLPVYDENKSPPYEDDESSSQQLQQHHRTSIPRSWSTQLIISTSGLGAALNDASLRSLKFVLGILRSANGHVTNLMESLKSLLHDYARGGNTQIRLEEGQLLSEKTDAMHIGGSAGHAQSSTITERIKHLNAEIWNTLKSVVSTVSRYTGGALPENASAIVRWQLMSVPRRWQKAVSSQPSAAPPPHSGFKEGAAADEKEALTSAHRMLAFAVEGIDMMEQVGGVVDSTILSAEKWLESMGRKGKQTDGETQSSPIPQTASASMSEAEDTREKGTEVAHGEGTPSEAMLIDTSSS